MSNYSKIVKKIIELRIEDMEFEERVDWYEIIIKAFEIEGWTEAAHLLGVDGAYDEALYQVHPELFPKSDGVEHDVIEFFVKLAYPLHYINFDFVINEDK